MSFSLLGYRDAINRNLENDQRITKEAFEAFISIIASICCLINGFIITQSDLMIASGALLSYEHHATDSTFFQNRFLMLFYSGELFGNSYVQ